MKKELTYSEAYSELEKLVAEIENENIPLDMLAPKVKKANELIKYCETKLRAIEADVKAAGKTGTTQ